MRPISPELAERARATAKETQSRYKLTDWLWALNLEARNDPIQLQKAALILQEMKPFLSTRSDGCGIGSGISRAPSARNRLTV